MHVNGVSTWVNASGWLDHYHTLDSKQIQGIEYKVGRDLLGDRYLSILLLFYNIDRYRFREFDYANSAQSGLVDHLMVPVSYHSWSHCYSISLVFSFLFVYSLYFRKFVPENGIRFLLLLACKLLYNAKWN
jgi:hypothetical protein